MNGLSTESRNGRALTTSARGIATAAAIAKPNNVVASVAPRCGHNEPSAIQTAICRSTATGVLR
jgi:hypothetical protein